MEAKAPTVSIIIPVYNVEKFLRKCLTSLVKQTFQDREIIAVNDGSTDHSLDILREFEQKYDFITVIDQKNRGMSKARNRGLSPPAGIYLFYRQRRLRCAQLLGAFVQRLCGERRTNFLLLLLLSLSKLRLYL